MSKPVAIAGGETSVRARLAGARVLASRR